MASGEICVYVDYTSLHVGMLFSLKVKYSAVNDDGPINEVVGGAADLLREYSRTDDSDLPEVGDGDHGADEDEGPQVRDLLGHQLGLPQA